MASLKLEQMGKLSNLMVVLSTVTGQSAHPTSSGKYNVGSLIYNYEKCNLLVSRCTGRILAMYFCTVGCWNNVSLAICLLCRKALLCRTDASCSDGVRVLPLSKDHSPSQVCPISNL